MAAEPGEDLLPPGETLYEVICDPRMPAGVFKPSAAMTQLGQADEYQFFSVAAPMLFGNFKMAILHDFCATDNRKLVALAFPKPWLRIPNGTVAAPDVSLPAAHLLLGVERPLVASLERMLCGYLSPLGDTLCNYPAHRISIPDPLYVCKKGLVQKAPPHYDLLCFAVQTPTHRAYLSGPTKVEDLQASITMEATGDEEVARLSALFGKNKKLTVDDISEHAVQEAKRKFDEIMAKARSGSVRRQ